MNRRGFLAAMLAAGAAPAIVRASSIMRINPGRIVLPGETFTIEGLVEPGTGALARFIAQSESASGNRILSIGQVVREALNLLNDNCAMIHRIGRDYGSTGNHSLS